jgi:MoaA/NifB/PqqE/SkfB family radical SAM enzyme
LEEYIQYRPGLAKLIKHTEHLGKIRNREVVGPIHLSCFVTNFCNLKCQYCCFQKTHRTNDELSYEDFCLAIDTLAKYGLKAIEISGGGESLLWSHFIPAIDYAKNKGLHLSLVSNGLLLKTIPQETLSKFDWIRLSVQSAKYAQNIAMDWIPNSVKKSMSFIVYNDHTIDELSKLYNYAKTANMIIRVAPNRPCTQEWETKILDEIKKYGYPFIGFKKEFGTPPGCYMIYLRAALNWKGEFLPCPSIELSPEYAGKIPDNFAVCKISEIEDWLIRNPPHDLGWNCSFCNCGADSNSLIHSLITPIEDVDFV